MAPTGSGKTLPEIAIKHLSKLNNPLKEIKLYIVHL